MIIPRIIMTYIISIEYYRIIPRIIIRTTKKAKTVPHLTTFINSFIPSSSGASRTLGPLGVASRWVPLTSSTASHRTVRSIGPDGGHQGD